MNVPLFHVDAFTDQPFAGNPAAVCLLSSWPVERWLQAIAAEMNLAETAFLVKNNDGYDLRWMTPTVEVALCGHATLASAHVLWQQGLVPIANEIRFSTKSGTLRANRRGHAIELDFPLMPEAQSEAPPGLLEALGVTAKYVGRNELDFLVEVENESALRALTPDFKRLKQISVRGVIVTSRSDDSRFDFVSRFFAPGAGIDEDPVTGSAHCCLGNFWSKRLGKNEFVAYQASKRGGVVNVKVVNERVMLGGTAVIVARGELVV